MRKYILNENQIRFIINSIVEDVNFKYGDDDKNIIKTLNKNASWFDYIDPKFRETMKQHDISDDIFMDMLKKTFNLLNTKYDLRRVFVYDKGKTVGFLVFSFTTKHKELIPNSENDKTVYPIILATAVHPDYRQRGLLKRMIEKTNIKKPFFVHTSHISTPEVWQKIGCHQLYDLSKYYGEGNALQICT